MDFLVTVSIVFSCAMDIIYPYVIIHPGGRQGRLYDMCFYNMSVDVLVTQEARELAAKVLT